MSVNEADGRLGRERETSFANIFGPQLKIASPFMSFCGILFT